MSSGNSRRILVRGVNWLGDAVMSTPALQRLREALPEAHITLLTHQKLEGIWRSHPAIDAVLTFTEDESVWRIGRRLRREKFDIGLVLPNSPRSALELWLAGIPHRIGYSRRWRKWMLTKPVPPRPGTAPMQKRSVGEINRLIQAAPAVFHPSHPSSAHHIHEYLHLAAILGADPAPVAPRLVIPDDAVPRLLGKLKLQPESAGGRVWFGLNAGAEYGRAKRWPEERFIEAAVQIQRRTKCGWMVFGLQSEAALCLRITTYIHRAAEPDADPLKTPVEPQVINLAGATNLAELCAALKSCRVLLTNDSGPMHVAAAVGTPVVVPFGSTSPELTGPGLPGDARHACLQSDAPCAPCFLRECPVDFRCMNGITVDRVAEAVVKAANGMTGAQ